MDLQNLNYNQIKKFHIKRWRIFQGFLAVNVLIKDIYEPVRQNFAIFRCKFLPTALGNISDCSPSRTTAIPGS